MRILIVDDEANLRRMLRALLEQEGHVILEAESAEAALARLEDHRPDTILLDLVLPGATGLETLPGLRKALPDVPVIMMSGEATLSDAARATREGAFHFLEKPLSAEAVLATVRAAIEVARARGLARALQEELDPGALLVGESRAIEEVRAAIRKVGPTEARVLIFGESGTGKELAATAIHALSSRRDRPFVRVNSAAIPRELVESEMFGHERGAFTGATERARGRFELAHTGTLFLDEVGDLGEEAQAKLLRALESGTIQRIGSGDPVTVDVRVLAATNHDLHAKVRGGRFREDLLFRLEVVPLHIPPLRDRLDDLQPLVEHICERLRRRQGLQVPPITDAGIAALHRHGWPGNVRELINFLERLAILHPGGPAGEETVRSNLNPLGGAPRRAPDPSESEGIPLAERLDAFERELIADALGTAQGNVAEAARRLRTDRANLYRRMRRLGLRQDD